MGVRIVHLPARTIIHADSMPDLRGSYYNHKDLTLAKVEETIKQFTADIAASVARRRRWEELRTQLIIEMRQRSA